MADPENHTLRVLIEFRNEFKEFKAETTTNFARITDQLDSLTQALAGETVLGRYAAADVDRRLETLEKRVSALEQLR